ncbi:hypothetical protein CALCODRAFT_511054 [Calocera cornea HHB12733]|uniref:Uncharacterized protein n=1 Tax=Calocera cornea HHB12733 TaxID=1353952 RepID=A0A165E2Y5_9BASI|nr:hypothetical protein CALCODRAFT_511054 [Calocera cornea HHB12733]
MSERYPYILANLAGETAPLTFTAYSLELQPVEPSVVPSAATWTRYPYGQLSFFGIDDERYSVVGLQWALLKWFLSKYDAKLRAANDKGRLEKERGWLVDIRTVREENLHNLIEDAQNELDDLLIEKQHMRQQIKEDLDFVRVRRDKRIMKDYRSGIPKTNALTTTITNTLLQDLAANIETVRGVVDRPQPNLAGLNGMQVNVLAETANRSARAKSKIRRWIKIKHDAFLIQREVDILKWNHTLLGKEIDLWSSSTSGFLTACGSLHFNDSSDDSSDSSTKSTQESRGISEEEGSEEGY